MSWSSNSWLSDYITGLEDSGFSIKVDGETVIVDDTLEIAFLDLKNSGLERSNSNCSRKVRIWQDQLGTSPEIIKSRINSLLGRTTRIHARETVVRKIDQPILSKFLIENHLNVPIKSKHKYGLFKDEILVAVAAFGKACPVERNGRTYKSHELIRFCNLLNHTVVGGLSKMLKYFIDEYNPEDIMTYVDLEWSDGKGYQKLGFSEYERTGPQTFYVSQVTSERYYTLSKAKESEGEDVTFKEIQNLGNLKMIKLLVNNE